MNRQFKSIIANATIEEAGREEEDEALFVVVEVVGLVHGSVDVCEPSWILWASQDGTYRSDLRWPGRYVREPDMSWFTRLIRGVRTWYRRPYIDDNNEQNVFSR
jgi:hypothetical protein